eukprot:533779_1
MICMSLSMNHPRPESLPMSPIQSSHLPTFKINQIRIQINKYAISPLNEVCIGEVDAPKGEQEQVIEPNKGVDEVVGNDDDYYWEYYTETVAGNDGEGIDVDKRMNCIELLKEMMRSSHQCKVHKFVVMNSLSKMWRRLPVVHNKYLSYNVARVP